MCLRRGSQAVPISFLESQFQRKREAPFWYLLGKKKRCKENSNWPGLDHSLIPEQIILARSMSLWRWDLSLVPTAAQEDQVSLIWIKESGRENQNRPKDWAINDLPKVKGLVSSKVKIWTQVFCLNVESWLLYSTAVIHSTSGSALASMAAATLGEGAVLGLCCAVGGLLW